jgi:hypothetical protein
MRETPVWIGPCLEGGSSSRTSGSSIYPAVQNMLLAARALGLGATVTTLYLQFEKEAEAALGFPPGFHSYALLPIGYPMGRFGPVRRIALADVVYEDQWASVPRLGSGNAPHSWISRLLYPWHSAANRVNAVAPGTIKTPMYPVEAYAQLASLQPVGRMGEISDIVGAIMYLEGAGFVTGEILHVDGGQSAGH